MGLREVGAGWGHNAGSPVGAGALNLWGRSGWASELMEGFS